MSTINSLLAALVFAAVAAACNDSEPTAARLYMDRHALGAGNVTTEAVAEAHEKDLAVQSKHGVRFLRYWVDEGSGDVYCLAEAPSGQAVIEAHREAHGLLPDHVGEVTEGQ